MQQLNKKKLQNCKTDEKIILGIQIRTSFFSTNFTRNIFRSDEYLASYIRYARRHTCYKFRVSLYSFQHLSVLK